MDTQASAAAAPAAQTPTELTPICIPRIGQHWPEQGGIFAGIVAGELGQPDTILILGSEATDELSWQNATDWAAGLKQNDHADWSLPNRREQSVLYGNCKSQFQEDWYWSNTQYAGTESYAWGQLFHHGTQHLYHKFNELRARAVRRFPI